jgi:hypothetical protein
MLFLWLACVAAFLARRITSWVVSRRITLFSLLRATHSGAAEVYVSLCHDCVWFFHWILFAIAGVTTAWSASTAAIFPLIAGAWNAVATLFLFGAAMEEEKHARIDRLDSLEFEHFLQTAHFPSCCVFPVSPEFLRMYVHAVVAWAGHATYGTYLTWVAGLSGTPLTCFLLPGGLECFPGGHIVV